MTAKERYRTLCQTEESIPLFIKDWWLDAVCGQDGWDVVLSLSGDTIKAAWPFQKRRKLGFTLLNMPMLTSNWGPWINYPSDQKYASRLSSEHQILTELIAQLPPFDYLNQRFRFSLTNGLPYYWKNFSLITRYTYVLENLTEKEERWNALNSSTRSQIRKAEKTLRFVESNDINILYQFTAANFGRQKMKVPYSLLFIENLFSACKANQSGKLFSVVDENDQVHASLLLVWDKQSAYYLAGATKADAAGGAFSLLMWQAIQFAASVTQRFDFEGSMLEPVERFFRTFGPQQVSYLQVKKFNSKILKVAHAFNLV